MNEIEARDMLKRWHKSYETALDGMREDNKKLLEKFKKLGWIKENNNEAHN